MKIAVSATGKTLDSAVDPRFGRAAGFIIVDPQTLEFEYLDNGASQAMAQGKPVVLDVADYPSERLIPFVLQEGVQTVASTPLISKGQALGGLTLSTQRPRAFPPQQLELLAAIGQQIGVAVDNARLFDAEQRRAEQFRVISEMGRRMTFILPVDDLLKEITRLLKEALRYHLVGIALIEGDELVFKAGAGAVWEDPAFQPPRLKVGQEGITGWVAQSGEPVLAPDVTQDPRDYSLAQNGEERVELSELAVPLKTKETIIGVLHAQSDRLNGFDESDLAVFQSLAHQAAIAIENARLYEQAQQVATLEERQRLARELHDSVTQTIFSMTLTSEAARILLHRDPARVAAQLEHLQQLAQEALAEMRSLIYELRPAREAEAGLVPALRQHVVERQNRDGLTAALHVEGEKRLPPEYEAALFRIVQEALNNVVKHAQTDQAKVTLHMTGQAISLVIEDHGVGFDPASVGSNTSRIGLTSMRERAETLGGAFTLESQPGAGARIKVEIPQIQEE
jgi:signal transduction histidine kinase